MERRKKKGVDGLELARREQQCGKRFWDTKIALLISKMAL